ncbi:MAG: hypothetical protein QOJ29_2804 [Thermoleophilaceae bacterium]|nr:hypothetical protein [Thermoleophilaceae bacterium]
MLAYARSCRSARLSLSALLAVVAVGLFGPAVADAALPGSVYTETNATGNNQVVVFSRGANGALTETSRTATGGNGRAANAPFNTANLDSQGAVELSDDQHLVFAVNAGSDTLSSFRVKPGGGLDLVGSVATGDVPFSVDSHGDLVYVLNENDSTIQGYRASDSGQLTPIPGSLKPLSDPANFAEEIRFDRSGRVLTVTHRTQAGAAPADRIDTFVLGSDGTPSPAAANAAIGAGGAGFLPFGFDYDGNGHAIVTNAGDGSISSYLLNATTGALTFIDNEVTAGSTPCWLVITPDSKFAFSGDSGSDVVTRLQIAADGTLTELGQTAVPGSGVAADVTLSPDGQFLTVLVPTENATATSQTDTYFVGTNGSLTLLAPGGQSSANLPGGVSGLAASAADSSAPDTAITTGPAAGSATNDNTPTFEFDTVPAAEPNPSFTCSVDGGAASACAPPFTTPTLAEGTHTFSVTASDFGGNTDATAATRSFTVDTTAPQTTIDAGPPNGSTTNDVTPQFDFSSSEPGSTFKCTVDVAAAVPCTSPFTTAKLSDGAHVFAVEATDAVGNPDPTPAVRTFKVQHLLKHPGCPLTGTQLVGTSGNNSLNGTSGGDLIFGLGGQDSLRGRAGQDCLYGGTGNDTLNGDAGADRLYGDSGADKLTDSNGLDVFSGGSGNDQINSRDKNRAGRRLRDVVNCGTGRHDVARVDRADRVSRSCERILRR